MNAETSSINKLSQRLLLIFLIYSIVTPPLSIRIVSAGQDAKTQSQDTLESVRLELQELRKSINQEQSASAVHQRDEMLLQQIGKSVEVTLNEKRDETWYQVGTTLIAVLAGAIVSFIASILFQAWLHRRERKSLQGAFVGEISALLDIIQRRNYIDGLKKIIEDVEQTGQPMSFHLSVSHEYFGVYKNNTSRLGILKHPLPQKIATFYTQCFSILEQVKDSTVLPTAQASLIALEELLSLFKSTTELGAAILKLDA